VIRGGGAAVVKGVGVGRVHPRGGGDVAGARPRRHRVHRRLLAFGWVTLLQPTGGWMEMEMDKEQSLPVLLLFRPGQGRPASPNVQEIKNNPTAGRHSSVLHAAQTFWISICWEILEFVRGECAAELIRWNPTCMPFLRSRAMQIKHCRSRSC